MVYYDDGSYDEGQVEKLLWCPVVQTIRYPMPKSFPFPQELKNYDVTKLFSYLKFVDW